jgi:hypothetical protein
MVGKVDSVQTSVFEGDGPGYEADFAAWSEEQSRRLRQIHIPGLDMENIAEEIESLSRRDKREIANCLRVLLVHLLKWRYQPDLTGRSWRSTIFVQRRKIADLLQESPSLRPSIEDQIADQYANAVSDAALETGLFEDSFPEVCEWATDQVLSREFLPNPAG